jgi:hypothetical protein
MKSARAFIIIFFIWHLFVSAVPVQARDPLESQVMAALLFNFTKYIEWPSDYQSTNNQLTICIAGNNPFSDSADKYQNLSSKGKTVKIRIVYGPQEIKGCNLLFIDRSEQPDVSAYLQQTTGMPILTASNISHFASNGGIIGFSRKEDRIRFEINPEEAKKSRLQISSQLLKLAIIVH